MKIKWNNVMACYMPSNDWKDGEKKLCFYARLIDGHYEPVDDDSYYGTEEEILNEIKEEGEDTYIRLAGKPKDGVTDEDLGFYDVNNFEYDEGACWTLVEKDGETLKG